MSVINQMLNDLDARSKQGQSVVAMPRAVQAVPESREARGMVQGWRWMIALVLLLLVFVLWFALTRPFGKMDWRALSLPKVNQTGVVAPVPAVTAVPAAASKSGAEPAPLTSAATPIPVAAVAAPAVSAPAVVEVTATPEPAPAAGNTLASLGSLKLRLIPELKLLAAGVAEPARAPASTPAPVDNRQALASTPIQAQASKPELAKSVLPTQHDKLPVKHALSSQQRAENEFRHALQARQQGNLTEALQALEQALQWNRQHTAARQTLVAWLLESGQPEEAIRHLKEGLAHDPGQSGLAMILARLQVDQGQVAAALATLQRSLPWTLEGAEYHAFLAALLQRQQNHKETIAHYQIALRLKPENALWWMGLGISLQAERQNAAARDAFQLAKSNAAVTPGFSADLQSFVEQRLNQLH